MRKEYLYNMIKTYVELSSIAKSFEMKVTYAEKAQAVLDIATSLYAKVELKYKELVDNAREAALDAEYDGRKQYIRTAIRNKAFEKFDNYFYEMCTSKDKVCVDACYWKAYAAIDIIEIDDSERNSLLAALEEAETSLLYEIHKQKEDNECEQKICETIDKATDEIAFMKSAGSIAAASIKYGRIFEILNHPEFNRFPGKYAIMWNQLSFNLKKEACQIYNDTIIEISTGAK